MFFLPNQPLYARLGRGLVFDDELAGVGTDEYF